MNLKSIKFMKDFFIFVEKKINKIIVWFLKEGNKINNI